MATNVPGVSIHDQWANQKLTEGVKQVWNDFAGTANHLTADELPSLDKPKSGSNSSMGSHTADNELAQAVETIKVAIVGAGAAGLFTGMIFDHLNATVPNFKVEYDILEAAPKERVGGRLFTHHFSKNSHDYFDVGAMRFPENPVMGRVFHLFEKLNMSKRMEDIKNAPVGSLIPYYIRNDDKDAGHREPWCFNNVTKWGNSDVVRAQADDQDPFNLNREGKIPKNLMNENPDDIMDYLTEDIRSKLRTDLEGSEFKDAGWKELMRQYDSMSTRDFLRLGTHPEKFKDGSNLGPFNHNTVEWMEMFNGGTNWYDQAHSETVLESLDFHYKDNIPWWCIVGGGQQLARAMETSLLRKPIYDSRVTAIEATGRTTMAVKANNGAPTPYAGVFGSVPLGCLKQIDTSRAGLNYATRQAIRSLGYGASAKVGMKFKKAWWIHDLGNYNIKKGGLGHSDLSIRTCVYPSYNYEDDADKSAVLLCSYTWQQDAQRMAAFISPDSPEKEDQLKELILRDLARLHKNEAMSEDDCYKLIERNYESHYAYDWYHEPNALGAFAFFRPGQFSNMWNKMIQPSGNLIIIGEAASPHHAWVVGALESAVHGVYTWLAMNHKIPGAQGAMEALENKEDHLFRLPPYMTPNDAYWQALLGKMSWKQQEDRSQELNGTHGVHCQEEPLYKRLWESL